MNAHNFLVLLGALLILAFLAEEANRRYRFPSALVLMVLGLVLGPILGWFPAESFLEVAPHSGVLTFGVALVMWGGTELLGASGTLPVLASGITLANERSSCDSSGWIPSRSSRSWTPRSASSTISSDSSPSSSARSSSCSSASSSSSRRWTGRSSGWRGRTNLFLPVGLSALKRRDGEEEAPAAAQPAR